VLGVLKVAILVQILRIWDLDGIALAHFLCVQESFVYGGEDISVLS
jgi:hypothetical protein